MALVLCCRRFLRGAQQRDALWARCRCGSCRWRRHVLSSPVTAGCVTLTTRWTASRARPDVVATACNTRLRARLQPGRSDEWSRDGGSFLDAPAEVSESAVRTVPRSRQTATQRLACRRSRSPATSCGWKSAARRQSASPGVDRALPRRATCPFRVQGSHTTVSPPCSKRRWPKPAPVRLERARPLALDDEACRKFLELLLPRRPGEVPSTPRAARVTRIRRVAAASLEALGLASLLLFVSRLLPCLRTLSPIRYAYPVQYYFSGRVWSSMRR